jgi:hypothetical protein
MAKLMTFKGTSLGAVGVVSDPVGPERRNLSEDVILVKACLGLVFRQGGKGPAQWPLKAPPKPVTPQFDEETATLIKHYKKTRRREKSPTANINVPDASVDEVEAGKLFTMVHLWAAADSICAALHRMDLRIFLMQTYSELHAPMGGRVVLPGEVNTGPIFN